MAGSMCRNNLYRFIAGLSLSGMLALVPAGAAMAEGVPATADAVIADTLLTVYKSPTCGCCGKWIDHVEDAGFSTVSRHPDNLDALKKQLGVQPGLHSCHTAVSAQGFVFEGHIPARFIRSFLASPPDGALGLSVPAMPVGSPGMEVGDQFMPYDVLLLRQDGSTEVYARVRNAAEQFLP